MSHEVIRERFFVYLTSGNRAACRELIDQLLTGGESAESIINNLFWPLLEQLQAMHREDQISVLAHNYATRLMRSLVDQLQAKLAVRPDRDRRAMVVCGPEEPEELAAQMVADQLEADGYEVFFAGGGVANDEIVAQLSQIKADALVIFGAVPSAVPFTRLLIDRLHDLEVCPDMQVVVGGGVFNRAEGLAEEIGADLWAHSPEGLIEAMAENPGRRAAPDQRTVGRKRRARSSREAA